MTDASPAPDVAGVAAAAAVTVGTGGMLAAAAATGGYCNGAGADDGAALRAPVLSADVGGGREFVWVDVSAPAATPPACTAPAPCCPPFTGLPPTFAAALAGAAATGAELAGVLEAGPDAGACADAGAADGAASGAVAGPTAPDAPGGWRVGVSTSRAATLPAILPSPLASGDAFLAGGDVSAAWEHDSCDAPDVLMALSLCCADLTPDPPVTAPPLVPMKLTAVS